MKVEYKFNSIVISQQDIQEFYPRLMSALKSHINIYELPKRRTNRKKKTVSEVLDRIIEDIEAKS